MVIDQQRSIKLTYLYNQEDKPVYLALRKYLNSLQRAGLINELMEQSAGVSILESTEQRLREAQVIILLISPNFDEDDFYNSQEIVNCLKKCVEKGALAWPIIARYIVWEFSSFKDIPVFFGQEKPIMSWSPSEAAYKPIIDKIKEEISYMLSESWVQDGDTYYHQMCFDEALVAYDNSLDFTPDYPPALLGNWHVLRKKGMVEEAKQCLEELLSLDTSLPQKGKDALSLAGQRIFLIRSYCKGRAWLDQGKFNDAHRVFREVFQRIISPDDKIQKKLCARVYCGEGDTFISEGRRSHDFANYYNQALDAYMIARSLDLDELMYPTRIGDAHVAFAEAYNTLNDRTQVNDHCYEALKIYEQIMSCYSYPPAFIGQGNVYFLLQRFNKALEFYESALGYDQYSAQAYGGKGNVLLALNNPKEALRAFEQALSIDDSDVRYHYGKGRALAQLKSYQEAFESYKMAVVRTIRQTKRFLIHYARVLIELGDVESMYGQKSEASKYYIEAEGIYQQVFVPGRNEKDIEYGYGKIYFAQKNWRMAFICYSKALSLDSLMSEAYLGKGKTHLILGNTGDAFACFDLANRYCQRPESTIDRSDIETALGDAHYYIAKHLILEDKERFLEDACSCYKQALQLRENAMAYAGLGKTYAEIHRDREAIDALNHAIELMPNLVQCYFIKGNCYHYLGQYAEAYAEYEQASNAGLDTVPFQKAFGEVLLVMKRYRDALQIINITINHMYSDMYTYKDQDFAHIFCNKGIALYGQGEDAKAILCFFKAYEYDQSICWERQYRQALEDIYYNCQKKLSTNPDSSILYKYKGDVLRLLGEENEKAIGAYTDAITYGETSVDTYYFRGLIYEKIQNYQNAFNDYCTVLQIDQNHQAAQQAKLRIESKIVQPSINPWQKIMSWLKQFS